MTIPALVNHIMDTIVGYCSPSSLTTLTLVSSHIRSTTLPHLVGSVHLKHSESGVISFLQFVIGGGNSDDPRARHCKSPEIGQHVRSLNITKSVFKVRTVDEVGDLDSWDEEEEMATLSTLARMLTDALRVMPNLRVFIL